MLRLMSIVLCVLCSTTALQAKVFRINPKTPVHVCESQADANRLINATFEKDYRTAEFKVGMLSRTVCHTHYNLGTITVPEGKYREAPIHSLPGYTHLVYIKMHDCTVDGRKMVDECHVLLVRSVLFGIHDDFAAAVMSYRRVGGIMDWLRQNQ